MSEGKETAMRILDSGIGSARQDGHVSKSCAATHRAAHFLRLTAGSSVSLIVSTFRAQTQVDILISPSGLEGSLWPPHPPHGSSRHN